jgi:peptide/nickel transport system substrate-binding protein
VLRTGHEAAALDVPGMAQALADGVRYEALAPLVIGARWAAAPAEWSGAPCDLHVRDDAPWLIEVARAVAASLSAPSHEVTARPTPAAEIAQRRASRELALMIDVVRPCGPDDYASLLALAAADDPRTAMAVATHPPHRAPAPRAATRTLRVGVLGEIRVQGGRAPDVTLALAGPGAGVDWGGSYRARGAGRT